MRLEVCPLRQTRQKHLLGSLWKVRMLDTASNFSPPLEKLGVGNFLLMLLCLGQRGSGEWVPWIFLFDLIQLFSSFPVAQEPLNWFFFLVKRIDPCVVNSLSVLEGKSWSFLVYHLAQVTPYFCDLYQAFINKLAS